MTRLRASLPVLMLLSLVLPLSAQHERREERSQPERPHEGRPEPRRGREQAPPPRSAPSREREFSRPGPERRAEPPSRSERFERSERPERRERADRPERFERPGRPQERPERREDPGFRSSRREPSRPQGREARPPARTQEAARAWQSRNTWRRDAWPARSTWREHRAQLWERDHRTWDQRGGYGGYVIPQPQYVSRFGVSHPFFIGSRPVIYQGYPRFRCGGYWFLIVDPWPEFWVDDWYMADRVYIDYYGDGYYLVNPRYPGIRLAITVFL